ncbi:hypothetical protein ABPG74_018723 [Tetrahymena malaccensis]
MDGDQKKNMMKENKSVLVTNSTKDIQQHKGEDLPLNQMESDELKKNILQVTISSVSISFGILLTNLLLSINLIYAGKLNDTNILSGIGLANVMMNCSGAYMLQGLNQGFSSLGARAYGAGSKQLLYDYLFKAFLTIVKVTFFFGTFLIFQEEILLFLNQDPEVAYFAYLYGIQILAGMFFAFFFDCFRNYLNAIGIFNQPMYIQFLSVGFQLTFCFLFVDCFKLGLTGICMATNFTYLCSLICIIYMMKRMNVLPDFSQFDRKSLLKGYSSYCKYVYPIALPMVVDIFCFEINSILIGAMKNKAYFSAHVILCNIVSIFYSFPLGLGAALCTLISNAVGMNNKQRVKNLYKMSYFFGVLIGIFFLFIFSMYDVSLANLYTDEVYTVLNFQDIVSIYRLFVILDNLQCSMQGILKGVGLGDKCLKMFLVCYYVIGTPISCLLAFTFELELVGFWIGFCIAISSIFYSQVHVLHNLNWDQQIEQEYSHVKKQKDMIELVDISQNNGLEQENYEDIEGEIKQNFISKNKNENY